MVILICVDEITELMMIETMIAQEEVMIRSNGDCPRKRSRQQMQKYTLYMTSKICYPTLKIYNKCKYQPMTMWTYKIKTAVNSVVYYVPSIKA